MSKIKNYDAIKELICLGFYARNNLEYPGAFLGKYKIGEKEYNVYLPPYRESSIIIKCENESFFLMVEDKQYREYFNGPLMNDVILHVNRYKNIDINEFSLYQIKNVPITNIINQSEILLNCPHSDSLYYNPNEFSLDEFEEEIYIFNEAERFDEFLQKKKFTTKMDGVFEPQIIIDIINQIYSNFEHIYYDNKINGIIDSLSQEELLLLREKSHKKTIETFKNIGGYYSDQEQKEIDNAINTLKRIKRKQDM